ncbi:MAG: prolipoprotein diacylglyceryl transferase [Oscillospiraceae bacterium]|nr:prolipoprotein diacylglyceryl transferase [Oscillospiraceae bacterium]
MYPAHSLGAPAGIPILTTQLIEAVCLFIIAVILSITYKKTAGTGLTACFYGLLYSTLRFILEFYRGDHSRGIYGMFSTSQYISITLFIISTVCLFIVIKQLRKSKQ